MATGTFYDLLQDFRSAKSVGTDDLLAPVLPLMEQVRRQHEQNFVAPLDGVDQIQLDDDRRLWFNVAMARPEAANSSVLSRIEVPESEGVDVTDDVDIFELSEGTVVDNRRIADRDQVPERPLYYLDYTTWEMAAGQHDALADIFSLGMIMGSLATGLDFSDRAELQKFVQHRRNIHAYNNRIHPVVSKIIRHMTEIRREQRAQDLAAIIETLDDYRRAEADDFEDRLARLEAIQEPGERRIQIQEYLRNRLFEISRRNRMLYFKETASSANLTVGSLPFMLDHRSIRTGDLIVTNERFTRSLERLFENEGREGWLTLKQYLRFEDYPFLAPKIDKIRLQAQADKKEYGFSQLRLVLAFLRWHNLSKDPESRIHTPLILVPLDMRKQRGSEDGFEISPIASLKTAEINPVLRHQLRDVYGIELDETIDVTRSANIKALHVQLEEGIQRRNAGVTIHAVTKPRIQLIQRTVIRQLEDFNRRTKKTGRGLKDYGGLAYSYDRDNYAPLGLSLFNQRVRVRPAPGREQIGSSDALGQEINTRPGGERHTTSDFYTIDQGEESDPLNWEIDLTSVTLSNFNYRKMSLVRDYAELRGGQGGTHANFDRLFTRQPRPLGLDYVAPGYAHRYAVLPCDPSQERAVLQARDRESYVIQGPPGTGKSQTIANLLVDFAARGRKVLFVCEKRVALDVVHHRLADAGLAELTSLIHDTKDDKRSFLSELKGVYETWRKAPTKSALDGKRTALVAEIETIIGQLEGFSKLMMEPAVGSNETLRDIIDRAVTANARPLGLNQAQREILPTWSNLKAASDVLTEIEHIAALQLPRDLSAQDLVGHLSEKIGQQSALLSHLRESVSAASSSLGELDVLLTTLRSLWANGETCLDDVIAQAETARSLAPLAKSENLKLLDTSHPDRARFDADMKRIRERECEIAAKETASSWRNRPDRMEVEIALSVARDRENSFLAFLYSDWRRMKRWVAEGYDGQVLSYSALLGQLLQQIDAREAFEVDVRRLAQCYHVDSIRPIVEALAGISDQHSELRNSERQLVDLCQHNEADARRIILALEANTHKLEKAKRSIASLYGSGSNSSIEKVRLDLGRLETHVAAAASLIPYVDQLNSWSPEVARAWLSLGIDQKELEGATLLETLSRSYRSDHVSARLDGTKLSKLIKRLEVALTELRSLNAQVTIETSRNNFQSSLKLFHSGEVEEAQRHRSEAYRKGCEILEHQFGLIRPSKSLRELLTGDSGEVLRDLKPIWMMSPLSVADTLPFSDELFDAVIFDEASQIPLEDAIPSLYRAKQTIIVGDEMQLPPTSFFSSSTASEEALPDYLAYAVSSDSLLTKAAATLAGTRLNWHYRSRHESLISFCNRAFYGGTLNTVPGRSPLKAMNEIVYDAEGTKRRTQKDLVKTLRDRQISFHRIDGGIYRNQRNEAEAEYTAELVRAHIKNRSGLSLGVVAFSQTQSQAIEAAIDNLAIADRNFGRRLEEEREREVDGQFAGLFVKNLENVQGDERDIILISVGYAPGPDGRMRMNFGPINQAGGEKRLNVIFSRAKRHIAVVSSIEFGQITNDYNTGANTLKQYLRYAAAVSVGQIGEMNACLDGLSSVERGDDYAGDAIAPVSDHIARKLEADGMVVEPGLGHSNLRIDLAARRTDQSELSRAILIDTPAHYAVPDITERYVIRPSVLRSFGWEVEHLFGKDLIEMEK